MNQTFVWNAWSRVRWGVVTESAQLPPSVERGQSVAQRLTVAVRPAHHQSNRVEAVRWRGGEGEWGGGRGAG